VPRRLAAALLLAVVAFASACAGAAGRPFPPPPAAMDDATAREVLGRFARALETGRFDEAHALLSARWRAGYTPGRLALDFRGAGPAAREATARLATRLASGGTIERSGGGARLALGDGRAALLVAEPGGWRVDALE
jgi:hypothetical protein